jgi:hypothetical protein
MNPEVLIQELQLAIGHQRMLLVIDDAWTEQAALALQVGGDHCVHLVTTRLPQVALAFAPQQRLLIPELDDTTGVELLAHYVPALVKENLQAVGELVSSVGSLPLALMLLGHYLAAQALSCQPRRLQTALQILHERQHRLQFSMPVASNERSPAFSSQTLLSLHTAIALSAKLLEAEAFRALRLSRQAGQLRRTGRPGHPEKFAGDARYSLGQGADRVEWTSALHSASDRPSVRTMG